MALFTLFNGLSRFASLSKPPLLPLQFPLKIASRNLDLTLNRDRNLPPPKRPAEESLLSYGPVEKDETIGVAAYNVKTSPKRLNMVARLIRDLSCYDALMQLQFSEYRCARDIYFTVLRALQTAENSLNVTDTKEMWVQKSYVGRGALMKRIRARAKGRGTIERTKFAHYFLILKLGNPPDRTLEPLPTKAESWLHNPPTRIAYSLYPSRLRINTLEERLGPKLSKNIDRDMPHAL